MDQLTSWHHYDWCLHKYGHQITPSCSVSPCSTLSVLLQSLWWSLSWQRSLWLFWFCQHLRSCCETYNSVFRCPKCFFCMPVAWGCLYITTPGFLHPQYPQHICKPHKSIYGLHQAPQAWFSRLTDRSQAIGFTGSQVDHSHMFMNRVLFSIFSSFFMTLYLQVRVYFQSTMSYFYCRMIFQSKTLVI